MIAFKEWPSRCWTTLVRQVTRVEMIDTAPNEGLSRASLGRYAPQPDQNDLRPEPSVLGFRLPSLPR
jgi:hypothetical protein